jgi:hypothetical protein
LLDPLTRDNQVERCHDGWHTTLEIRTGTPMMNPFEIIFYAAFWNLHFFIDNIFEKQLFGYRTPSNLLLRRPYQIMQYIEQRFPAIMGRI